MVKGGIIVENNFAQLYSFVNKLVQRKSTTPEYVSTAFPFMISKRLPLNDINIVNVVCTNIIHKVKPIAVTL